MFGVTLTSGPTYSAQGQRQLRTNHHRSSQLDTPPLNHPRHPTNIFLSSRSVAVCLWFLSTGRGWDGVACDGSNGAGEAAFGNGYRSFQHGAEGLVGEAKGKGEVAQKGMG
jgi:hypothetical protein